MRNPKGSLSRLSFASIQLAEAMQARSVDYINEAFHTESDEVDINRMTYHDFITALETAEKNGTRDEFERRLADQLLPMIQAVMAPPEQTEGQPQQPQGGAIQ
jgi:Ca2+-binding EF-hand superfamily protein